VTKFRFKPEDFTILDVINGPQDIASKANLLLDKAIAEAPVVYGHSNDTITEWLMSTEMSMHYTHKAVLFNIEELAKKDCKHEPSYTLSGITQDTLSGITQAGYSSILTNVATKIVCSKCGITLKARWEAAE
jgi:hypothetical protein